ncbi:hypothetical protein [Streptomyces sp. ME19-01-6]|uniref:hypothetical protein n=1 Tax=Streptomyces sp. ME19-01-6 TaxID=3028686 RepID=UPI0029A5C0C8|nr:hypothetical protein [Streptomyces sp. ME19-01-6]MDX3231231.1 hypothetical protein [Streptomyces sp. ME19-01-6]
MSAPDPWQISPDAVRGRPLLVLIDPTARRTDGESVRIAKDVLCAGAATKICLPEGPEEVERALARRGSRRPVVVGDHRALLRTVELLHRKRELADAALAVVPVGGSATVALARALGLPTDAVSAARTALDGTAHRRDLLVDESGGVVLGGLRISGGEQPGSGSASGDGSGDGPASRDGGGTGSSAGGYDGGHQPWWTPAARTARSALTLLSLPGVGLGGSRRRTRPPGQRLRVEADGVLLADLDRPVERVSVSTATAGRGGLADVVVHPCAGSGPVRARARAVTVSGPDFRYHADTLTRGPVRTRTWTVLTEAWRLMLPRGG